MPDRVDRRRFLGVTGKFVTLSIFAPGALVAACRSSSEKHPKSLLEGATQADYNEIFDQLFEAAKGEKDVRFETRLGGPEKGLLLIRFGEPNTNGLLVLEKGFRPTNILGMYLPEDSAKSIDLIEPTTEGRPVNRLLVASWKGQAPLRFLPPEKYTNADEGVVEPHKLTSEELGPFLAKVYASFNAVRLPPLDQ